MTRRTPDQQKHFVAGLEAADRVLGILARRAIDNGWACESPRDCGRFFSDAAAIRTARERLQDRIDRERRKAKR
jgi:hypothetical protein